MTGDRERRRPIAAALRAARDGWPAAPRPRLRGWLHLVCFFASIPAGIVVIAGARSATGRAGAIVYAVAMTMLFGVSGTYHRRRWSAPVRLRLGRADHAAIFVMIAGTATPLMLVALDGAMRVLMLVLLWAGAAGGVVLAISGVAERKVIGVLAYIALGWAAVLALPDLSRRLTATELLLVLVGGLIFTVGAIVLGLRWPDPFPRVFGYHEVWHVMVLAAVVCHFVVVFSATRRLS